MKLILALLFISQSVHALKLEEVKKINLKCENAMYFEFEKTNSITTLTGSATLNGLSVAKKYTANISIDEQVEVEIIHKGTVISEFQPSLSRTECFHEICMNDEFDVKSYTFEFGVNKNTTICYLYLFE